MLRLSDDFLLPEDSPLYEDGLQDSNEIMQMLSGLESSEAQSVRASARIKSKRTLSTFGSDPAMEEDDGSLESADGSTRKKKKVGSKSTGGSSSNKPVTDQQRIERR